MLAPLNAKIWSLLVMLSVLWGGSFFFVEVAVPELPTLTIVFLRVGIAALVLHVAMTAFGKPMKISAPLALAYLGMAILNNIVPFSLIAWGQIHISSALASVLNATTPLFTIVVAHVLTRDEKLTVRGVLGLVTGFAGVVVILSPEIGALGGGTWGQLAVLGAAVSYAFAGVFGKRFARLGAGPFDAAAGQLTASAVVLAIVAAMVEEPWTLPVPSGAVWASIIGLAVLSTSLAYTIYFKILAEAGATNLLLVTFLIPVSAIVLGVAVLGETLDARQIAGTALIMTGLCIIDGRIWVRIREVWS